MNKELFYERLKEVSGYKTQTAIADDIGVTQSTIAKWKRGEQPPKAEDLLEIAKTYKCSIDYLLGIDIDTELTIRDICKMIVRMDNIIDFFIDVKSDEYCRPDFAELRISSLFLKDPKCDIKRLICCFLDEYNMLKISKIRNKQKMIDIIISEYPSSLSEEDIKHALESKGYTEYPNVRDGSSDHRR